MPYIKNTTKPGFIQEINIRGTVLEVWQDQQTGAYFAVEATFLDQVSDTINDPYNDNRKIRLAQELVK